MYKCCSETLNRVRTELLDCVYHFAVFRSQIPPEHDGDDSNVTWASFSEAQV